MNRTVNLSELSDRDKDTAILTLQGFVREQGELLGELAQKNRYAKKRFDELVAKYVPRMKFLERTYVRGTPTERVRATARRNDGFWGRVGVQ